MGRSLIAALIFLVVMAFGYCAQDTDAENSELEGMSKSEKRFSTPNLWHKEEMSMGKRTWVNHEGTVEERREIFQKKRAEWKEKAEKLTKERARKNKDEVKTLSRKKRDAVEPVQEQKERRQRGKGKKGQLKEILDVQGLTWEEYQQMDREDRKTIKKTAHQVANDKRRQKLNSLKTEKKELKGKKSRGKKTGGKKNRRRLGELSDDVLEQARAIKHDKSLNVREKRILINRLKESHKSTTPMQEE